MAALSFGHLCHHIHKPVLATVSKPRTMTIVSCQKRHSNEEEEEKRRSRGTKEEDKGMVLQKFMLGVEKLGKGLRDNLSPKRKGDWKDLTLISLSFAVYVYISQKIVCAYCTWMSSMAGQPW